MERHEPTQGTFHEEWEKSEAPSPAPEVEEMPAEEESDCKVCDDAIGGCPQCGFGRNKKAKK